MILKVRTVLYIKYQCLERSSFQCSWEIGPHPHSSDFSSFKVGVPPIKFYVGIGNSHFHKVAAIRKAKGQSLKAEGLNPLSFTGTSGILLTSVECFPIYITVQGIRVRLWVLAKPTEIWPFNLFSQVPDMLLVILVNAGTIRQVSKR